MNYTRGFRRNFEHVIICIYDFMFSPFHFICSHVSKSSIAMALCLSVCLLCFAFGILCLYLCGMLYVLMFILCEIMCSL